MRGEEGKGEGERKRGEGRGTLTTDILRKDTMYNNHILMTRPSDQRGGAVHVRTYHGTTTELHMVGTY